MHAEMTDQWQRLLTTAQDRALVANYVNETTYPGSFDVTTRYDVSSFTHPDHRYRVTIRCTVDGVDASCDCEAGSFGKPCTHAALALNKAGLLPMPRRPEPVAAGKLTAERMMQLANGED